MAPRVISTQPSEKASKKVATKPQMVKSTDSKVVTPNLPSVKVSISPIKENSKKDKSPNWDGHLSWDTDKFAQNFRAAMQYYNLEFSSKDLKPAILKWMASVGYEKAIISELKKTKDWRCGSTMGALASCFLRGMPVHRDDFNNGKDSKEWLDVTIKKVLHDGTFDVEIDETGNALAVPVISIQDRVRDSAYNMTDEIENALELFHQDPESFDPKAFKMLNLLRGKQVKAAHARIIKQLYQRIQSELEEVYAGKDEQLKEAYAHIGKKNIRKLLDFYKEISAACDMLGQEAKVNRKPKAKKTVSKDKLVEKLNFLKLFDPLKLVSINPIDIIGSKELWVYNTITRKLGQYVSAEFADLGIKGTSIVGFDETKSVQKTLRKPVEQLKAFKVAGKVQLRKFLEEVNATDIKLSGRINEDTILLKVQ